MAEERIDSIIDLGAIKKEIDQVNALTDKLGATLKSLPKARIQVEGAQSAKEFSAATAKLNQEVKAVISLANQRFAAEAKVVTLQTQYAKATAAAREEIRKSNVELKNQAQLQSANNGSIERARAQIKAYTLERDRLNLATEEGRKRQEVLNDRINKFNEFIKKNVSSLEQQKINVGNYAGSLAKPFETLQKKLEEIRANLAKGIGLSGTTNPADLKSAEIAINAISNAISVSSTQSATATKQVKALENAYQALSITTAKGDATTNTFLKDLAAEIGEAKDQVQDLKDEIKLNASDTKGIDNLVGSLNALAGIAQGAAGAYALLGANQEDAAKITSKLIAVQGIANSIQQVGQELTRRGSLANKIYEGSVETLSVAFGKGSTAAQRWQAILKVGGVGLLVAGLVVLVNYLSKANDATSSLTDKQKALNEVFSEANSEYTKAVQEVENLRSAFNQAREGIIKKEAAVKLYNESIGKTTGQVKTLDEAEQALAKNAAAYIKFTLLKAQANIALSKAAAEAFRAQEIQQQSQQALAQNLGKTVLGVNINELIGQTTNKALDDVTQKGITFVEIYKNLLSEVNKVAKEFKFDPLGGGGDGADVERQRKIADQTAQAILQEQFERQKIAIQRSAATNQAIFENEQNSYEERLSALRLFIADQADLIEAERVFAVESEKLRIKEVIAALEEQKKEKGANIKAINDQEARERQLSAEKLLTIEARAKDGLIDLQTQLNAGLRRLRDERKSLREQEQKDAEKAGGSNIEILKGQADEEVKIEEDKNERIKEARLKLYDELRGAFFQLLDDSITREVQYLDEQKRLLDESTQRRINQINLLGLNEVERTRQVAIVEKQAQFQTEQIEKRKRQLAVERARFQKFADIANIISSTALAVTAALSDRTLPTPARIALAGLVGGIGVVQLARAIAAPLPRFFKGKKKNDPYTGFGIVNDGPTLEAIERKEGFIEFPKERNKIEYLRAGDIVHKDANNFVPDGKSLVRHMIEAANPLGQIMAMKQRQQADYMTDSTGRNIVKAIKNLDTNVKIIQHITTPVETTAYFIKAFR